jgi:hypothetical protein
MAVKRSINFYAPISHNILYTFKTTSMLDEDQQIPPFLKLHIELHEQFEGFRTFTNFHELLLPKNRTEQP